MADIMKRWDGSQWVPVLNVDRSVIERVVEIIDHGIVILYTTFDINRFGETCTFSLNPLAEEE